MKAMNSFFLHSKQRRIFGSLFEQIKIGIGMKRMVASFITESDHRFSKIPLNISKTKWD